ncbi:hypothetical protein EYW49_06805 [Siculibacillus lacustris]|uniref:Uncharacterized protein n=1 Tax=Siculibacillus lacustris TaxID=1549641 RepID=A0A4Q9VT38_9HYPH|nr:hypothetical protein [Siculibacillus lacustris]TBW39199.1 hypothetical protein EYW49_06805 [Siculibacillus lacustris]
MPSPLRRPAPEAPLPPTRPFGRVFILSLFALYVAVMATRALDLPRLFEVRLPDLAGTAVRIAEGAAIFLAFLALLLAIDDRVGDRTGGDGGGGDLGFDWGGDSSDGGDGGGDGGGD